MEMRSFQLVHAVVIGFLFSIAFGSSSDILPTESSHKAKFITEPSDGVILPSSRVSLSCEAKFVSSLKFNCSGGVIPREIYLRENKRNKTKLIVAISKIKPDDLLEISCVCDAIGYSGLVLRSKAAVVKKAYLGENIIISPSAPKVAKDSQVTLKCYLPDALPSPNVSWLKDGVPLVTHYDGRVEVINQDNFSQVVIRQAWTSDSGYYSCQVSNPVGRRSDEVKLNVYVDGGWSAWREFSPCTALDCGNGTRMMKRHCTNPSPENGGKICKGPSFKEEFCMGNCPGLKINCPDDISVYVNHSDSKRKVVYWNRPEVNGTDYSIEVTPPWAVPPVELVNCSEHAVYVITYVLREKNGQTANCSFNITVFSDSARANKDTTVPIQPPTNIVGSSQETLSALNIGIIVAVIMILLLVIVVFVSRFSHKSRQITTARAYTPESGLELGSFKKATLDSTSPLITHSSSYVESAPVVRGEKLRAVSPTFDEEFDFIWLPLKESPKNRRVEQAEFKRPAAETTEVEIVNERTKNREQRYERTNSAISNKSTVSDISRMMWNISNLPENVNPKMMAWGLVDHNGGRFTIGDTGVSLIVPPQAIPEGHTEGIYIAIMDQEKDHPHITAKEALLSPVVKCGPNGLKFKRPVVLSLPHCALLEDGAWNLKVQYNETESGAPADWKQLIDINKQDGSDPCLALLEPNMVYLMVDHFTSFAVTGNSAASERAKKIVKIVAYVTPPAQANGDCVVRVYCVGDLPVHLENLHSQETERLLGITREAPQPFYFTDGGGDLLVNLTDNHPGWKNTGADQRKIRFKHVWEGIECMPSRSFTFSLVDKSVPQFRASFEVTQDCQDGDEQEVSVSTAIKQTSITMDQGGMSESSDKATEQTCYCGGSASLSKAASEPCLEDDTAAVLHAGSLCNHWHSTSQANILLGGAGPGSPIGSPIQLKNTSSGYFSFGFEPSPSTDSLSNRIRNELILILDPPHPKGDWKSLAEGCGFEMKHIRWLANCNSSASPTDMLLTALESKKYPLYKLAEKLRDIGRDDAATLVDHQLMLRETEV